MRCAACKGVYHPATGHLFTPTCVLCGPCARDFLRWWKGMVNRRWGKLRFYDFAHPPVAAAPPVQHKGER